MGFLSHGSSQIGVEMRDRRSSLRLLLVTTFMALLGCRTLDRALQHAGIPCGIYRWPVKTLTDRDVESIRLKPIDTTIGHLAGLSRPATRPENRRVGNEFYVYRIKALLASVHQEPDQDLHLRLRDPVDAEVEIIAEIPSPGCAIGSRYESAFASARQIAESLRVRGGEILVEVSGVGFFDTFRDQMGGAPNGFELHPVLELSEIQPVRR